ncbi:MAG: hypothetical protein WC472_04530 [Candidatus Paceibacterota bacterium]
MTEKRKIIEALILYGADKFRSIAMCLENIGFSFDEYLELFSRAHSAEARFFAFERMLTYEFFSITRILDKKINPDEKTRILRALQKLAITFKEYFLIYSKCENQEYRDEIFEIMLGLATTFEEWKQIYDHLPQNEQEKKENAFQKLIETATSPDQLFEMLKRIYNDKESERIILEKMRKCEPSIEWLDIYNKINGGEVEEIALQKIKEFFPFLRCFHVQI